MIILGRANEFAVSAVDPKAWERLIEIVDRLASVPRSDRPP